MTTSAQAQLPRSTPLHGGGRRKHRFPLFCALVLLASGYAEVGPNPASAAQAAEAAEPAAKPQRAPVFQIRNRTKEPLLRADKPWESLCVSGGLVIREGARWRMWYGAYDRNYKRDDDACLCYAESPDGCRWTKPNLGIVEYQGNKNNNILISGPKCGGYSCSYVFLDEGKDPRQKYKMIWHRFKPHNAWWVFGATSADGIHWNLLQKPLCPKNSDTTTPCIPEKGKYRLYTRVWQGGDFKGARAVGYTESDHFGDFPTPVEIFSHDNQDPEGMQFYASAATKLTDNLYVMLPAAFYTKNQTVRSHLAWSRDGIHFTRYGREPVVDLGTTFDNKGVYVMPGATPGDVPNTWWFYYFGTKIEHDSSPDAIKYDGGIGRFLLVLK
ncbi:MAG: hypothetical protein JXQ73_29885 [Phycisphaerae bacterium]|nr:hypothetical protein [Phycisphaerae bacterium]